MGVHVLNRKPSFVLSPAIFRVGDDVRTPLGLRARVEGYTTDGRIDLRYFADASALDRRSEAHGSTVALQARLLRFWRPLR